MRRAALGAAAALLYVAAAVASWQFGLAPGLVLFDGLAPPEPYRWVKPPPEATTTEPALDGRGEVQFGPEQSFGNSISTADGQATVVFRLGSVKPAEGQTFVDVAITPLDASELAPPPEGLAIAGNAYEITGTYRESGRRAELVQPIAVVMRYPVHATVLLVLDGQTWKRLETTPSTASLQVFGEPTTFGTFAAAAEGPPPAIPWWAFVGAGAVLFGTVAYLLATRGRGRPQTRSARRRASRRRDASRRPGRSGGRGRDGRRRGGGRGGRGGRGPRR